MWVNEMELQVIESQLLTLLETNEKEALQVATKAAKKYENLVLVDEDALPDYKSSRAENNKFIKELKDAWKSEKAKHDEEIAERKALYDEAIKLFAINEENIKKQVDDFESDLRNVRKKNVEEQIASVVAIYQLDERHAPMLTLEKSYLTKDMTKGNKLITILKNRAEEIAKVQQLYNMQLEMINTACKIYNFDNTPWLKLLETQDVSTVVNEIHLSGNRQREKTEATTKDVEKHEAELKEQEMEIETIANAPTTTYSEPFKVDNGIYTHILKISGTGQQMHMLNDFLTDKGFEFTTLK